MRVLMLHNAYRSGAPSGENLAVGDEAAALRDAGWSVDVLETTSDDLVGQDRSVLDRARAAPRAVWNRDAARTVRDRLQRDRPDIVHVQNDYPLLGPAVHRLLGTSGVPYVQSIRNYRFACVVARFYRDGEVCTRCLGKRVPTDGIRFGCDGGLARSTYVAGWIALNNRERARAGPLLIANSQHVATRLVDAELPADRVRWRHNIVPLPTRPPVPRHEREGVVVAGRLEPAKGIVELARAWADRPPPDTLTIFGDGPDRARLDAIARDCPTIHVRGPVPHAEVLDAISRARLVVVPSRWEEPFGRVALEGLLRGTPALVTEVGGLPEVVEAVTPDMVVPPQDAALLVERARWAIATDALPAPDDLAATARSRFGPDVFLRRTEELYREAMDRTPTDRT